jgi:NitT/TauT family transport system substrate-binding protein
MTILIRHLLWLLVILLALVGCTEPTPPSQLPIKISVLNGWPSYMLAFVAEKKGFFAKQGVQVQLLLLPDYPESLLAYKKDQVDGWYGVVPDMVMLNAQGMPTVIVYDVDYSDTADLIVSQPKFKELSELKGKKVSFEGFNTFSHLFVLTMLEKVGIHEGEFKAVVLPSPQVLSALKSGEIDAGHLYEPAISEAIAAGFKPLAKAGDLSPNVINSVLAFHEEVVKNRPEELRRIIRALTETQEFAHAHPQEAFSIMAQAEGLSLEEITTSSQKLHFLNRAENIEAFKPHSTLFLVGQQSIDFYEERGQLLKKPSLESMVDGQFVRAMENQ